MEASHANDKDAESCNPGITIHVHIDQLAPVAAGEVAADARKDPTPQASLSKNGVVVHLEVPNAEPKPSLDPVANSTDDADASKRSRSKGSGSRSKADNLQPEKEGSRSKRSGSKEKKDTNQEKSTERKSSRKKSADKEADGRKSGSHSKGAESSNSRSRPKSKENTKDDRTSSAKRSQSKHSQSKGSQGSKHDEKEPGGRGSRAKDVSHRKRASVSGQKTKQSAKK
jgi:hypothetical protein